MIGPGYILAAVGVSPWYLLQWRRRVEKFGFKSGDFPVTEYVSNRTIALPFFTKMTNYQIDRVCDTLEKVLERALVGRKPRF